MRQSGELLMSSAADECGWRVFPTAGGVRISDVEPLYYAQADIMERFLAIVYPRSSLANKRVQLAETPEEKPSA